jgi:hypothetical protein
MLHRIPLRRTLLLLLVLQFLLNLFKGLLEFFEAVFGVGQEILFGEEPACESLRFHHLAELSFAGSVLGFGVVVDVVVRRGGEGDGFEVGSITLFDNPTFLEDVNEILSRDLREVVCDDDGSLVLPPPFESFKDEYAGCSVQR